MDSVCFAWFDSKIYYPLLKSVANVLYWQKHKLHGYDSLKKSIIVALNQDKLLVLYLILKGVIKIAK